MPNLFPQGVHEQKQDGKCWVGIHVPVGRLSADECEVIAALADKYSGGEIRLTVEQNILLPNVDKESGPCIVPHE
jgi:ferredoxin-nitrite reductase